MRVIRSLVVERRAGKAEETLAGSATSSGGMSAVALRFVACGWPESLAAQVSWMGF